MGIKDLSKEELTTIHEGLEAAERLKNMTPEQLEICDKMGSPVSKIRDMVIKTFFQEKQNAVL